MGEQREAGASGSRFRYPVGGFSSFSLLSVGMVVVAGAWFAANLDRLHGSPVLLWCPASLSSFLAAASCWSTYRAGWLPAPTRRFWRHLAIVVSLVGVGSTIEAYDTISGATGVEHGGPVALSFYTSAVLVVLWAMYRLPSGATGLGERLRIALDAGTVMLATAVFIWHFQTRGLLADGAQRTSSVIGALVTIVLTLVAVFAVAKVVVSGHAFVDKRSLQFLAIGLLGGTLTSVPQSLLVDRPWLICSQVSVPLAMVSATLASQRQHRTVTCGAGSRRTARRFSILPYAAVVAIDALLLSVTWTGRGADQRAVAVTAVVLTAMVVVRQITAFLENGRLLARLDHGATHDALTQLPNRALFGDRLRTALATPHPDRRVSVALIDLDDFKTINDTLGHGVGDALLVAVAQRLVGCVRSHDTVGRLGGDEFVVVLDDIEPSGADLAAERMLAALATPVQAGGQELLVRASIGIADGTTGDDAEELLRRADIAMYRAKHEGGSGYARFDPAAAAAAGEQAPLGAELRQAIAEHQLHLVYQPIVALDGERITGVEALARWSHPTRGPLSPAQFIPVAERTGLIVPLGNWILREACRQFVRWSVAHGDRAPQVLNVNVSARQLREPNFPEEVAAALADTGIAPDRLVLEITETAVVTQGTAVVNLGTLRRLGVRIALDDFGTGVSGLSLLEDCPVDELKLDRSFTQADPAAGRTTMAVAVIHLARALGLHVVAEGVETPQQAQRLRALGYPAAQGFYFARPMAADDLDDLLAGGRPHAEPAEIAS